MTVLHYEHSQPSETLVSLPDPDEIEADLTQLAKWEEEFARTA
jgi:hypothetical protein